MTSKELRGEEVVENRATEVRELCERQAVHLEHNKEGSKVGSSENHRTPFETLPDCAAHMVLTDAVKQKGVKNHPARYRDIFPECSYDEKTEEGGPSRPRAATNPERPDFSPQTHTSE